MESTKQTEISKVNHFETPHGYIAMDVKPIDELNGYGHECELCSLQNPPK